MLIKPHLMIHDVQSWMFKLPLHEYILTFDDALYGQYYFLEQFKKIETQKIFFVSTNIICDEINDQRMDFPTSESAHQTFFSYQDSRDFMKWSQILEIKNTPHCFIGGHSHHHGRYDKTDIRTLYNELIADTQKMINVFKEKGITVSKFCYPYNEQYILYEEILKNHGINEFFGKNRIAIESLR